MFQGKITWDLTHAIMEISTGPEVGNSANSDPSLSSWIPHNFLRSAVDCSVVEKCGFRNDLQVIEWFKFCRACLRISRTRKERARFWFMFMHVLRQGNLTGRLYENNWSQICPEMCIFKNLLIILYWMILYMMHVEFIFIFCNFFEYTREFEEVLFFFNHF